MNKRIVDSEEELRLQTDQFSRCYTDMKDSNDNLVEQLKRTRKENLTMKRLNIISQQNKRKGSYVVS